MSIHRSLGFRDSSDILPANHAEESKAVSALRFATAVHALASQVMNGVSSAASFVKLFNYPLEEI